MKIQSIEIKGLWHLYNLTWNLNSRVNVLAGGNGAGKTTILNIVSNLVSKGRLPEKLVGKADKVTITFDNGLKIINTNFNDTLHALSKKAEHDEAYRELWNDVDKKISQEDRKTELDHIKLQASMTVMMKGNKKLPFRPSFNLVNASMIGSFDSALPASYDTERLKELKEEGVESALDIKLHEIQTQYAYYIGDLANRMEKLVSQGAENKWNEIQALYLRKNTFISMIDALFEGTGKRINREKSRLEFISDDFDEPLSVYQLSSGEKQIIFILLSVLLQNGNEYILFMDEPEISLHIEWQEVLMSNILDLNPNCQIVSSSHAPSLIVRGWQESVTGLEEIKHKEKKHGI